MSGGIREVDASGERDQAEILGDDEPPARRRRGRWLILAVVGLAACAAVAGGIRHRAGSTAVVDRALLVTGASYDFNVVKGAPDRIGFTVENLGDQPVRVSEPRIEAVGVTVVGTVGAGRLVEPRQSARITISFWLRCADDWVAQQRTATVVVPYTSTAGRRHEIRETPQTPGTTAGAAVGAVIDAACAPSGPPASALPTDPATMRAYAAAVAELQRYLDAWRTEGSGVADRFVVPEQRGGMLRLRTGRVSSYQPWGWTSVNRFTLEVQLELHFVGSAGVWNDGLNDRFITFTRSAAEDPYLLEFATGP
jgi:hypothetical protein